MESSTWLWILLAVVAIVVLVAVVMAGRKKKLERDRHRAHELREEAVTEANELQRREAQAREVEAEAARAEHDAEEPREPHIPGQTTRVEQHPSVDADDTAAHEGDSPGRHRA